MLTETDADYARWTVVEAHDRRFATLKIFATVIDALERGVVAEERKADRTADAATPPRPGDQRLQDDRARPGRPVPLVNPEEVRDPAEGGPATFAICEHEIYLRRVPVIIAYEGWDAAGKGGNIRRLTQNLDPRGYEVVPIAAPNDIEKAHHYLWRFWAQMPKAGHITIFDRTWYGRVLVERVEGFCTEAAVAPGVPRDQRDGAATGALRDGPAEVLAAHRSRGAAAAVSGATGNGPQTVEDHRGRLAKS